jgi:predicted aldo/keto reductase-like oxidoreductase
MPDNPFTTNIQGDTHMKRRTFLKVVGGVAGSSTLGINLPRLAGSESTDSRVQDMTPVPRRILGRTGEKVSIIGFPGLACAHGDQDACTASMHKAIDRGVNYFDVAPAYGRDGECEIKMGIGLQGIDRSRYFLACKTKMRDKDGAREELERSLERLKTDHFDLYQMHHIRRPEEVQQAFGPGGCMETFFKAQEEGKVRYLGFSAHTTKGALEAMKSHRFDTVMFPINFVEYYQMGFGKPVLQLAREQGAAVLAIKAMSLGGWPEGMERTRRWWYRSLETEEDIDLGLRFSLSQPGVVVAFSPAFLDLADKAFAVSHAYRPLGTVEEARLKEWSQSCLSIFRRQEEAVAQGRPLNGTYFAYGPDECYPGMHA